MLSKRNSVILLAASILSAGLIDMEWLLGKENKEHMSGKYIAAGMVDNLFEKESKAKYSNVVSKNIFSDRVETTHEKNKKIDTIAKVDDLNLELRGVTITPDDRYALIQDKITKKTQLVKRGDTITTWKVISIKKDHVLISSSGIDKELYVNKKKQVTGNK